METVLLTAHVTWDQGCYVAKVDQLTLEASGDSVEVAKDELIEVVRAWIQDHDGIDSLGGLGQTLADAGFPGVEDDTEVQLEFVE
ncbi:MAG: hypothetical protein BZY80_01725 [SAR202 cluster bacterium Io17-Chloro-G2]|nr:MAG: hypothetical protein BZY80_01725 [SAR202 cluster bacterium Io17-Chloro-G2]